MDIRHRAIGLAAVAVIVIVLIGAAGAGYYLVSTSSSGPATGTTTTSVSSTSTLPRTVSTSTETSSSSSSSVPANRSTSTTSSTSTSSSTTTTASTSYPTTGTWILNLAESLVVDTGDEHIVLNTTGFLIIHVAADGSVTGTGMGTGTVDQSGSPCVGKGRIGYNFTAVGGYIAFVGNFSIAFPSVLPQTFIWSVSCNGYPPSPANYGNPFPVPAGLAMQLRDGAVSSGGWTYTDNSGGGTYKYRWSLNACPGGLCPAA